MRNQSIVLSVVLALVALVALPADGAFVVVDDFEGYSLGNINGQGDWSSQNSTFATVGADPADAGNQVIQIVGSTQTAWTDDPDLTIANNTTATLFLRFRFDDIGTNSNVPFGMAKSADVPQFADYGTVARNDDGNFDLRDAGKYETTATNLDSDVWYNAWFVIDNSNDVWEFYVQSDDDADYATVTRLGEAFEDADPINFRGDNVDASDALTRFMIGSGQSNTTLSYFDDLYLDASGENLVNPIPEPASLALVGLGGLLMLPRRRKALA